MTPSILGYVPLLHVERLGLTTPDFKPRIHDPQFSNHIDAAENLYIFN